MDTLARDYARRGAGDFRAGPARARPARRLRGLRRMMRASHTQPGFLAALLHRLSGIALAIFLPLHFLALATALDGAAAFDRFLAALLRRLWGTAPAVFLPLHFLALATALDGAAAFDSFLAATNTPVVKLT